MLDKIHSVCHCLSVSLYSAETRARVLSKVKQYKLNLQKNKEFTPKGSRSCGVERPSGASQTQDPVNYQTTRPVGILVWWKENKECEVSELITVQY